MVLSPTDFGISRSLLWLSSSAVLKLSPGSCLLLASKVTENPVSDLYDHHLNSLYCIWIPIPGQACAVLSTSYFSASAYIVSCYSATFQFLCWEAESWSDEDLNHGHSAAALLEEVSVTTGLEQHLHSPYCRNKGLPRRALVCTQRIKFWWFSQG